MKVGIVGLGLMGGSFGKALKASKKHEVLGCDANEEVVKKAVTFAAIDLPLNKDNIGTVDFLIAAVTPDKLSAAIKDFLPLLKNNATVIDFCGVKNNPVAIMKVWEKQFPSLKFYGGHPMAGKEFYGIDNADEKLFTGASMIIVPLSQPVTEELKDLFYSAGVKAVTETSAEEHDKIIAYTSQLCHIVSSAYIKSPTAQNHAGFSAGSYKDLSRVARLNPEMWAGLIMENKDNALKELSALISNLKEYETALRTDDKSMLKRLLKEGNDLKEKLDGENK